jgi:cysteine-rich repeat protein
MSLAVECDLTSIGGSSVQPLYDDGSHGDTAAGDNDFTLDTVVGGTVGAGAKQIECVVSDAQMRAAPFDIALTVLAVCGDGSIDSPEDCDDTNSTSGDGCDSGCSVEPGFECAGEPSTCSLVPTTTTTNTTTTTLAASSIDDLTCYKVKDLKNPAFIGDDSVALSNAMESALVAVTKPALLCLPTGTDGSPIHDPDTHVCCYKIKSPKLPAGVRSEVVGGLGTFQVEVKKSGLYCQPCARTLLP